MEDNHSWELMHCEECNSYSWVDDVWSVVTCRGRIVINGIHNKCGGQLSSDYNRYHKTLLACGKCREKLKEKKLIT